jgi:hypothetical protein
MDIDIQRWGIFPDDQTIDLNLSCHDFPKGKGRIRVSVKSTARDETIETRLWRENVYGHPILPAGSATGKSVEFEDLEPGSYKINTRLRGEYHHFLPQSKEVDLRSEGETANVAIDINDLFGMNLTIVDDSDIAADGGSNPPYTLFLSNTNMGKIGKIYTGLKQVRIGGFRKGLHLVSVGVRIDYSIVFSRPVEVLAGSGTPSVFVELKKGGKKVFLHKEKEDRDHPRFYYDIRFYDEADQLWMSVAMQLDRNDEFVVLPSGLYRVEFREENSNQPGPKALIDTTLDNDEYRVCWNRGTEKITVDTVERGRAIDDEDLGAEEEEEE